MRVRLKMMGRTAMGARRILKGLIYSLQAPYYPNISRKVKWVR